MALNKFDVFKENNKKKFGIILNRGYFKTEDIFRTLLPVALQDSQRDWSQANFPTTKYLEKNKV